MEKILRDSLFAVAKNNKKQFWTNIEKAVENTTMLLNIKVKRKGSKNIYIPIKMKSGYSKFLSYNWILKSAKNRHEKKLSNKFVNEIIDTAENKSNSIKKKIEIYKLIEDNMHNVSKR
jgi:ribosomal protein S7